MSLPTHRVIATGERVFPGGHDPADLELLPANYWEDDALESAKAEKRRVVKELRNTHEAKGVMTPFGMIDSDPVSQRKITGAVLMALIAGESFSIEFTMANNTNVTMNGEQITLAGVIVGQHVSACQARKTALDALINDATTQAELDAIDPDTGWP